MTPEYSSYLVHHGVKGQKWGVRRYQNEDGTLTDAGRAKLSKAHSKSEEYTKKRAGHYQYDLDSMTAHRKELEQYLGKDDADAVLNQHISSIRVMNETSKVDRKMSEFFAKNKSIRLEDANKALAKALSESKLTESERKKYGDAVPDLWRRDLKRRW
jgi:hypothetical protein